MQPNNFDSYKLSEEKHEAILTRIKGETFRDAKKQKAPIVYVLGGQPGSGKGRLIYLAQNNIEDIAVINGDEFRRYHPRAKEIFDRYGKDYALYTDPDVREWTRKVFDEAIEQSFNIVFEGTMRTTHIRDTIQNMHERGYMIRVMALGVNKFDSKLCIYERFFYELEKEIVARFSSSEAHDEAYKNMPDVLDQIERDKLYENLEVFIRGGISIYLNDGSRIGPEAKEAVLRGRSLEWSIEKKRNWIKRIDGLINYLEKVGDKYQLLQELRNLRKNFISEIIGDSETAL